MKRPLFLLSITVLLLAGCGKKDKSEVEAATTKAPDPVAVRTAKDR
jgi:hypothetical protein